MNTLDSHLTRIYTEGKISYGELITKAKDPEAVIQKMQQERAKK
jgi:Tfp pilus assembly ATPase PilU